MAANSQTIEGILKLRDEFSKPLDDATKKADAAGKRIGASFTKSAAQIGKVTLATVGLGNAVGLIGSKMRESEGVQEFFRDLSKAISESLKGIPLFGDAIASLNATFAEFAEKRRIRLAKDQIQELSASIDEMTKIVKGSDAAIVKMLNDAGSALGEASPRLKAGLKDVTVGNKELIDSVRAAAKDALPALEQALAAAGAKMEGVAKEAGLTTIALELLAMAAKTPGTFETQLKAIEAQLSAIRDGARIVGTALEDFGVSEMFADEAATKLTRELKDQRAALEAGLEVFRKTGNIDLATAAVRAFSESLEATREYDETWDSIAESMREIIRLEEEIEEGNKRLPTSFQKGWQEGTKVIGSMRELGRTVASEMQSSFSSIFEGLILDGLRFQDIMKDILRSIARLLFNQAAGLFTSAIFPSAAGAAAAKGAIFPGHFTPIKAFAAGSPRVDRPTIGLIGEGRRPEAVVPLPDGRSIPVEMRGADGGGREVSITIHAMDSQDVIRALNRPDVKRFLNGNTAAGFTHDAVMRRSSRTAR